MYSLLHDLLADQTGGVTFSCFGIWHWLYMIAIFAGIGIAIFLLKNKNREIKQRAIRWTIGGAFGLYMADFFLMPFAYGEIDIEKLPFHMCTAMCVMCFLSRHNRFWAKFKLSFAMLGLISNLIYVIYPAGVGWYQVHPLCYRTFQTLLFHGIMTAHGLFVLLFDEEAKPEWNRWYRDLGVITAMILWALLGNTLYNGVWADGERLYNWSFVVRDPFYMLPASVAPFVMPFVMILLMFSVDMLIYALYFGVRRLFVNKHE